LPGEEKMSDEETFISLWSAYICITPLPSIFFKSFGQDWWKFMNVSGSQVEFRSCQAAKLFLQGVQDVFAKRSEFNPSSRSQLVRKPEHRAPEVSPAKSMGYMNVLSSGVRWK
jgi:hypothetical protein